MSWAVLARLGRVLGASGARLGCVLECQRSSWRHLGAILGRLGVILGHVRRLLDRFGRVLEAFWEHFGNIFKDFLPYCAKNEDSKKPRKNNGFSLIIEIPGRFWGSENL